MSHSLELLFPTPVAFFDLGFELTKKEMTFLLDQEKCKNIGNARSRSSYLLDKPELVRLSDRVQECVTEYATEVWKADIQAYVTQSWLNWTKPNEFHHRHNHSNSLYSGVLYIDVDGDRDKIVFCNEVYGHFSPVYKEWTKWNSETWWYSVKTGMIVIFPSRLLHMVETVPNNDDGKERVSLAFNTFAKKLGSEERLDELVPKHFS